MIILTDHPERENEGDLIIRCRKNYTRSYEFYNSSWCRYCLYGSHQKASLAKLRYSPNGACHMRILVRVAHNLRHFR